MRSEISLTKMLAIVIGCFGTTSLVSAEELITYPDSISFQVEQSIDSDVDLASWSECGDELACCDDTCNSSGCCSCSCCSKKCCDRNCGLLGMGRLTYDECSNGCVLPEKLLGCFCETKGGFDDFISPMTNPVYFEDPRQNTELRTIFLEHKVPNAAGGGNIQLYALQIRARLSDRWTLIAAKDGYVVSTNPLIDDGWSDVDLGLKYTFFRDVKNQTIISGGLVYDIPVGTPRTLMGQGDGEFHYFLSGGTEILDCGHWISNVGGIMPVDQDFDSTFLYWSNHIDYQVRRGWYAVGELNWFHWTEGGNDRPGLTGIEGGDLFHLGSGGVGGNDFVTGALGIKYKPNRKTEIGIAYEEPLTNREDVMESRFTFDMIFRY